VARDVFIRLNRCAYCGRPGVVYWDEDLLSCEEELCKSLAYAAMRRRNRNGHRPLPERRLARALLAGYDTLAGAIELDRRAELLGEEEARRMRDEERRETAWLLSEVRALARRHPPRPQRLHRVDDERIAA
jgi:hypothetical protein